MKTRIDDISIEKKNGWFYTPDFVVQNILDLSGYHDACLLKKHVMDNSCGDGAFLVAVVDRYCEQFFKYSSDHTELERDLARYIHGIEIDKSACRQCKENLDKIAVKYSLGAVNWDIRCGDALDISEYDGKMDFVVGNPPYVRVHNLGDSFRKIKRFSFAQNGMTDLYIVFYEIGLKMLNSNGVLGYITPNSFFNSVAGKFMRNYFVSNNLIDKIVNLRHFQAFDATTYTTIVILKKNRKQKFTDYYQFDEKNNLPYYVESLCADDYYFTSNFYFSEKSRLKELKRILSFVPCVEYFGVKNGFATLADDVFIGTFDFSEYVIPVVKASTGKWTQCFFPYREGKLIPYSTLESNSKIKEYLENNKDLLLKRSLENAADWYGFGRTQGINDVGIAKYSINTLIRNQDDIKLIRCESGQGVYSGLYIITDIDEQCLRKLLFTDDFTDYVSLLGKYKSCGYYTFSSKDLKRYLEYKFAQRSAFKNEQPSIFNYTGRSF